MSVSWDHTVPFANLQVLAVCSLLPGIESVLLGTSPSWEQYDHAQDPPGATDRERSFLGLTYEL